MSPRQLGAIRAAETRRREATYRAAVKVQRAREQRAAGLAERRRVIAEAEARRLEVIAGADLTEAEAAAEAARREKIAELDIAAALQGLATAASGQSKKEMVLAQDLLKGKQQLARIERMPVKPTQLEEIKLGREYLEERVQQFYDKAKLEGKIKRLSEKHNTGKSWRYASKQRTGAVVDRNAEKFLNEGTLEYFIYRMTRAAERAKALNPRGNLYVSISMVEYGKHVPNSPGPILYEDALGQMRQGFEGTKKLAPPSDIATFALQVRMLLEGRLREAGSTNAIMISSFEVKSFHENSEEEKAAFVSKSRGKRKQLSPGQKKVKGNIARMEEEVEKLQEQIRRGKRRLLKE